MLRVRTQHHIERMNDAWHIAQQGQHKIEPKMACQTNLTQHAERWEDNGKDYFERVGNPDDHGTLLTESTSRTSELVLGWSSCFLHAQQSNFHTTSAPCSRHTTNMPAAPASGWEVRAAGPRQLW